MARLGKLPGTILLFAASFACGPSGTSANSESGESGSGTSGSETETNTSDSGTTTGATDGTDTGETSDTDKLDLPPICDSICGNKVYGCADGMDNDDDGLVDMADPDCLSPCHDAEDVLWHGIPGFDWACRLDCLTDANGGQGDDGCSAHAKCQPNGGDVNCEYDPNLEDCSDPVTQQCKDTCLPSVPPGCDCFGCCEVETDDGPITVHTGWPDPDCSMSNLDGCSSCEQNEECLVPCDNPCQWCFGQPEPPQNCEELECVGGGQPCTIDQNGSDDCPSCEHCLLGCCVPTPEW